MMAILSSHADHAMTARHQVNANGRCAAGLTLSHTGSPLSWPCAEHRRMSSLAAVSDLGSPTVLFRDGVIVEELEEVALLICPVIALLEGDDVGLDQPR